MLFEPLGMLVGDPLITALDRRLQEALIASCNHETPCASLGANVLASGFWALEHPHTLAEGRNNSLESQPCCSVEHTRESQTWSTKSCQPCFSGPSAFGTQHQGDTFRGASHGESMENGDMLF